MAKKTAKKPVTKPVEEIIKELVKESKTEESVEKVPFQSNNEVKVSGDKTLNFEEGIKNAHMLLKCFGNGKIQLGKNTDGNVISCKNEVHAILEFSEIWQLMSVCKL